jgi:two-component system chemotaxis sensor kinase CheA
VYRNGGRSLGLVVDRILDIVEEEVILEAPAARPGVLGSAVIQGQVTEILDVPGAIEVIDPTTAAAAEVGP